MSRSIRPSFPSSFLFRYLLLSLALGLAGHLTSAQSTGSSWALATVAPAASSQPADPGRPSVGSIYSLPAPDISQADFNGVVYALLALPDGTLFAAGSFTKVGNVSANRISKWNGRSWVALGEGVSHTVHTLAMQGSNLFVGGEFTKAGGQPAPGVARWDGQVWHNLAGGLDGPAYSLAVMGKDLFVGGHFTKAGGIPIGNIARWDGTTWQAVGANIYGDVTAMAVSGTTLYAGLIVRVSDGSTHRGVSRWDGRAWSAVGGEMESLSRTTTLALVGNELYVLGYFSKIGDKPLENIARWDGREWQGLGSGLKVKGFGNTLKAIAVLGRDVYAGGSPFHDPAQYTELDFVAKWNGTEWACLGSGVRYEPGERRLGVGSETSRAKVNALAVVGNKLYVGGDFSVAGGQNVNNFACWDGTRWVDVTK